MTDQGYGFVRLLESRQLYAKRHAVGPDAARRRRLLAGDGERALAGPPVREQDCEQRRRPIEEELKLPRRATVEMRVEQIRADSLELQVRGERLRRSIRSRVGGKP